MVISLSAINNEWETTDILWLCSLRCIFGTQEATLCGRAARSLRMVGWLDSGAHGGEFIVFVRKSKAAEPAELTSEGAAGRS